MAAHVACQLRFCATLRGSRNIAPSRRLFADRCRWAHPERDMRWLHRLLDHGEQFLHQQVQVHFLAQGAAESCDGLDSVILTAIEATINDPLNAMAQRLEEGSNDQR